MPPVRKEAANKVSVVQQLLAKGADINAADNDGSTSLINAVDLRPIRSHVMVFRIPSDGMVSVVQQLLAAGADVNAADKCGITALHLAVEHDASAQAAPGMVSVVQQMLAKGAEVIAADSQTSPSVQQSYSSCTVHTWPHGWPHAFLPEHFAVGQSRSQL
jgi:ankyrin repeat protein